MSVNPMHDSEAGRVVGAEMAEAFSRVEVGPPPVESVLRRGRTIRNRRRAVTGGTVAAVAAVAALVGTLAPGRPGGPGPARPAAAVPGRVRVDVPQPAPDGGTRFSGSVDGRPWAQVATADGCELFPGDCAADLPLLDEPVTASFGEADPESAHLVFTLRPDIAFARLVLADGSTADLVPAAVVGHRFALAELPYPIGVIRVDAVDARGALVGSAYPFVEPGGKSLLLPSWTRPGDHPDPGEASQPVSALASGGKTYTLTAHVGPYGVCFTPTPRGAGIACDPPVPAGTVPRWPAAPQRLDLAPDGPAWLVYPSLPPAAARLTVTADGGQPVTATPAVVRGRRFAVLTVPAGTRTLRVRAFDAAGAELPEVPQPDPPSGINP